MGKIDDAIAKAKSEPDEEIFMYEGYKCLIKRNPFMGFLCGYVGLKPDHKYYRVHYDKIDIDCHGGLTFSDTWGDQNDELWYIGFNCGHGRDLTPFMTRHSHWYKYKIDGEEREAYNDIDERLVEYQTYKDINYVRNECKRIVNQLEEPEA